jgi:putative polyketide hydroxylase
MPIVAHRIGDDLIAVEESWPDVFGITPEGVVIVRPDTIIQWKTSTATQHPERDLEEALLEFIYGSSER